MGFNKNDDYIGYWSSEYSLNKRSGFFFKVYTRNADFNSPPFNFKKTRGYSRKELKNMLRRLGIR